MSAEQTNVALAVITFLLAVATVWLAIATWKMASATRAMLDLESRPYFAFKGFQFKFMLDNPSDPANPPTKGAVQIGLQFRNPGRVLVHFSVRTMRITFSGATVDSPKFQNMGGSIHPDDETVFWYPAIPNIDISQLPRLGVAEYEIEYYAMAKKVFRSTRKIQYSLNSITPAHVDWLYLEQTDS